MKVSIISYDELPESEKENYGGWNKDEASYLKIEICGQEDTYYSDAMEPEDARFDRDLAWIKVELLKAYKAGKEAV